MGHGKRILKGNLVPYNDIAFSLPKLPTILHKEDFEKKLEIKKQQDK